MDAAKLKENTDIVHVIGQSIGLKRSGPLHKGLCPFHKDSTPSLMVYTRTQSFYCFGCAASGDVLTWVQRYYGLDFMAALEFLQDKHTGHVRPSHRAQEAVRTPTKIIPITVAQHWHTQLGDRRSYFHGRGFNDETIDRELWGWSGTRYVLTVWRGVPQESPLLQVRLRRSNGDEKIAKYVGLTGFNQAQLYNFWAIRGQSIIHIFFGEFDAALATQLGLPSCSPTNGMLAWQDGWNEFLKGADEIYIVPDRGEEEAAYRVRAAIGLHTKVKCFPKWFKEGKDFTDWVLAGYTIEEFLAL